MDVFYDKIVRIIILVLSLIVLNGRGNELGQCPKSLKQVFGTKCTSCDINVFVDCPPGSTKLTTHFDTESCQYYESYGLEHNITKDGCYHECEKTVEIPECCKGFWGANCDGKISFLWC